MSSSPSAPNETADRSAGRKMTAGLAALSSACVLVVYSAGFLRTKAAADRLAEVDARRRPNSEPVEHVPAEPRAASPATEPTITFTLPTRPAPPRSDQPHEGRQPAAVQSATAPATAVPTPVAETAPAAVAVDPAAAAAAPVASMPVPATDAQDTAAPATTTAAPALYKDGTYLGWGTCRHGDIQASVTIADGRIVSAAIAQCWTRYTCNWLDPIVPQVVARQSPNVDYVSGATQSTDAFYWAVVDALSKAK